MAATLGSDVHVWCVPWRGVSAEALFRPLIAAYASVPADDLPIVRGEHGKPWLSAPLGELAFSWSHSGDTALCAIARGDAGFELGVDIERVRPRPRLLALAERFFSPSEAALLRSCTEETRLDMFLALWTSKEAVLKAHGGGLSYGLHRASFHVVEGRAHPVAFDGAIAPATAWTVQPLDVRAGFAGAIAWRGASRTVRLMTQDTEPFPSTP
ncbi:4'-phosphopantetheinyl transferase [Luteibacter rhizovicinus]|uniref:4'-phosphopantetheinyl transferase n=1 Tax=Luteibacter rhizovicinus TaxID=242606 RepID=A0A4R3YKV0_9GAMM|nr:4'-phosphopantetheinyl transferase superfamily protein [Luteibacter rhizovicinus]TCV92880.1 4'-phosphopantetheinyl transferase [Luteibacter rhizovicinus]